MNTLTIQQILLKYWGVSAFRPMQEEVINSVLEGRDTLVLMPTGGGKSLCYQLPVLAQDGIGLVISPLISLMKDQVDNLVKKGIPAIAVYSGIHPREIDIHLDNCLYGKTKFLFMSPERLKTDIVRERLRKMKINLICVDEAHCISHWGYDFRPPYLEIAEIRDVIKNVPVIALTASATEEVVKDIQVKLKFKKENVFKSSFERKNLIYEVIKEEDKFSKIIKIINENKGSGIIYVRNRRKTKEIADFLNRKKITSDFYHAGLDTLTRNKKQNAWMKGTTRVIVATNAFGMGIDKPNVRFVIHLDLSDNIESYYQEAGRAGRDGERACATILYNDSDILDLKKNLILSFPETDKIKQYYQALGNYLNLAVGSGQDTGFDFEISEFCNTYDFNLIEVFNGLKILEQEGLIMLTEAAKNPSKLYVNINSEDLYRFQVENKKYDFFIKILLRSYTGLFNDFVKINETDIAQKGNLKKDDVVATLEKLQNLKILTYVKQKDKPQIFFLTERMDAREIAISKEIYQFRKKAAEKRAEAIIKYVSSNSKCRNLFILEYFNEKNPVRCGNCDVCNKRNKMDLSEHEFNLILNRIKPLLIKKPQTLEELVAVVETKQEDNMLKVVQWLLDNDKIIFENGKLFHRK